MEGEVYKIDQRMLEHLGASQNLKKTSRIQKNLKLNILVKVNLKNLNSEEFKIDL